MKKSHPITVPAILIMLLMPFVSSWSQTTIEIEASKDNTLIENAAGNLSNGSGDYLFAGKSSKGVIKRALVYFDIAGNIPAGSTINSAALHMTMSKTTSSAQGVSLHLVQHDWGEGASDAPAEEGAGASAGPGDATWLYSFYDTTLWEHEGGDFEPVATAELNIASAGDYTWGPDDDLAADVQHWFSDPASNHGWLLMGNESSDHTSKRFNSRNNDDAGTRPVLEVTYTGPDGLGDELQQGTGPVSDFSVVPNPFAGETAIRFRLSRSARVSLTISNVLGQQVVSLVQGNLDPGMQVFPLDGTEFERTGMGPGIYYAVLSIRGERKVLRLVRTK